MGFVDKQLKERIADWKAVGMTYRAEDDGFSLIRDNRSFESGVYIVRHYKEDAMQIRSWRA